MTNSAKTSSPESCPVLFTCAGRRVVLLRAFRAALERLGVAGPLIATDLTVAAPALHVADVAACVPPVRDAGYLDALLELTRRHRPRLLVPLTDLDLPILATSREAFAEVGCSVMVAPPGVIADCRDKHRFQALLARAGLAGIPTVTLEAFRAEPFYPCFVKPTSGSAGVGSARIESPAGLDAHVATFGPELVVQQYVPGQEFTIDIFCRRDGVVCAAVPRQRLSVRCGEVEKALTVRDDELIAAACRLADHMPGLWGVINAQCRRPPGGPPRFIEVNPRFGGGAPLALAAGVDLPAMVLAEVLGRPVAPALGQFTDRLLMLRYDEAIFTPIDDPASLPGYAQPHIR